MLLTNQPNTMKAAKPMLALINHSVVQSLAFGCVAADFALGQVADAHRRVKGPWPDEAQKALESHAEQHGQLVAQLIATPALTLEEVQAKALALRTCMDNQELLLSLLNDLEGIV